MQLRITNGFDKMSDEKLTAKAKNIMEGMTGNEHFTSPTPTLVTVQTAINAFDAAAAAAKEGSMLERAEKNQKKADLAILLHSLGNYVLFTADGDRLIAISSNFTIARAKTPGPAVGAAQNQQLKDGINAGTMIFSFTRGARR